mgnify:FL=1
MAFAKTDLFEKKLQMEANLFKALSHPARIQILLHLAKTRTCLQGDSSDLFPLSRTTINHHINELRKAELIKGHNVEGKTVYCLNLAKIKELKTILSALTKEMTLPDDFCCEFRSIKMGHLENNDSE